MLTKRLTRAVCALLMLGALVAFTGCGGSDNKSSSSSNTATTPVTGGSSGGGSLADYKTGAEKAANDFKNSAQAASTKVSGATGAGKIAGLEALKASVTQAADAFQALNPPSNLKADNDELVAEFRSLASVVDQVEQAVKSHDQSKAAAVAPQLVDLQTKIATTIARIQTKLGP
jgi:hypothetical protein